MNIITGNEEIVTFFVICMLFWAVVTGRVEAAIRSISGAKDTTAPASTSSTNGSYPSLDPTNPTSPPPATTPGNTRNPI